MSELLHVSWRRTRVTVLAVIVAGTLVSCDEVSVPVGPGPDGPVGPTGAVGPGGEDQGVPGSGDIVTETHNVSGFDRIVFRSEGAVIVAAGGTETLEVEADDNLQQYLEASVSGGVLEITSSTDIAPSEPPLWTIGVGSIAGIDLAGAGSVEVGQISANALEVALSGVGDVTIGELDVGDLTVSLSGVGTITLTGAAQTQDVAVTGVGVYDGAALVSGVAFVAASGDGEAIVWVSDELEATASEAGVISYYGEPTVTEEVSGIGTVTALGPK